MEVRWTWKYDGSGSWIEVEVGLKWKLDGSGSWIEVEARWMFFVAAIKL